MRKTITLLFLICIQICISQVSYNSTDFISIGEQYIVSKANSTLSSLNFTQTGANFNWDYSSLTINTQDEVSWIDPNNAGYKATWCLSNGYIANCNTNFNNAFNLANQKVESIEIGGYGLTNLVSHYKKSATDLQNKMLAGTIVIGNINVPMTIDYTMPDIEYQFPIQFNDNYTHTSQFEIDLTSLGVPIQYTTNAQRTNLVEGWGSLITPYATFANVLKMKTTVISTVTLTTSSGPNTTTTTTISYKWFDPNYGIPVLEVSGEVIASQWVPTVATYIDNQQCLQPTALFGYLPLVADYDPVTQSAVVSFVNTSTNYDTSTWNFGDGITSTDTNPAHTYSCPGTKQVTLTVVNEFCSPNLTASITLPIIINDSQNAFTEDVTVTTTSLIADRDLSGTTYQWIDCDNGNTPISGETSQVFTPSVSGNYAVILTTNGCESTSQCYSFNLLGTESFNRTKNVLYPNPTTGKIYTTLNQEDIKKIAVYDVYGKVVSYDLNNENLPNGIYFITIETMDKRSENFKMIIDK